MYPYSHVTEKKSHVAMYPYSHITEKKNNTSRVLKLYG